MDKSPFPVDKNENGFFKFWFAGLFEGLERLDGPARTTVLRACGQACADSYTAAVFREAKAGSLDTADFLRRLGERFPEARYERLSPGILQVRYNRCACDLVQNGLVRSPALCLCSAYNLQANFQSALGVPIAVSLEDSILRGAAECVFIVSLSQPGATD